MANDIKILKLLPRAGHIRLTLSGSDDQLHISDETAYRLGLKEGIVLTPSQVTILERESALYDCDRQAARLLALREHLSAELAAKLRAKGHPRELVDEVINKYARRGILDDSQTAFNLARSLLLKKPCGRAYMIAFLVRKMVDRSLAETIADTALLGQDEVELAAAALRKRVREYSQFELEEVRNRAYNYLSRRGFSYEVSRRAFEQMATTLNEVSNDQDV